MLLPIHIAAGGLAIVLGAVALLGEEGRDYPPPQRAAVRLRHAGHGHQRLDPGVSQRSHRRERDGRPHDGLLCRHGADDRPAGVAMDPPHQCRGADGRGRTRARRDRGRRQGHQQPARFPRRRPVSHDRCDVLHPRHRPAAGGGRRRAHHAIRHASRRAAPGAPSVAHVLRALHRGRIVLLDP